MSEEAFPPGGDRASHEHDDVPLRAHKAHQRFGKSASCETAAAEMPPGPSKSLDPDSPEIVEKLEALDDAVFEAINGREESLQRLTSLWPVLRTELGEDLLAESREQYLRYAMSIWQQCVDRETVRDPLRAVHALDVLCVLFDEE